MLFSRGWIARDFGEAPSPVQAAFWLDLKRTYMELRPNLRRIYTSSATPRRSDRWSRRWASSRSRASPIELDGVAYHPALIDFGPSSIDGWLSRLVAAELQIDEDSILDVAQRQLVLDGRRVDLTKLEFEVLNYLYQRPGQGRRAIGAPARCLGLRLRGRQQRDRGDREVAQTKLGSRAAAIETVRGLGYRFVASA